MEPLRPSSVVIVRFPFSDLSASKLRPALVIAILDRDDLILGQITSKAYSDPLAIEISGTDFESGSLNRTSYIRPGKIFTASRSIVSNNIGELNSRVFESVRQAITKIVNGAPAG